MELNQNDNPYIVIEKVSRNFDNNGGRMAAIQDINLTLNQGEFVCIVGGSGCGKSTLLRAIAGIDPAYEGSIRIEGKEIRSPSKDRGMIFQDHRLFPWLTAEANVAYALNGISRAKKKEKARSHLELVGLKGFEKSYPKQLSGGMAQRCSIARALVNQPSLLLLDEPFGALDAFTKMQMQNELLTIKKNLGSTMILVTHDIEEAVFLADRVIILSQRPGMIKKILKIELPNPKDRNAFEFNRLRKKVYDELFEVHAAIEDYVI